MNKYITALLVVLASTGVEAQTYQSALRIALGDATIEDLCHKQTFKGIEQDILSVLDAIKQSDLINTHQYLHIILIIHKNYHSFCRIPH